MGRPPSVRSTAAERVRDAMDAEMQSALRKAGVTAEWLVRRLRREAELDDMNATHAGRVAAIRELVGLRRPDPHADVAAAVQTGAAAAFAARLSSLSDDQLVAAMQRLEAKQAKVVGGEREK